MRKNSTILVGLAVKNSWEYRVNHKLPANDLAAAASLLSVVHLFKGVPEQEERADVYWRTPDNISLKERGGGADLLELKVCKAQHPQCFGLEDWVKHAVDGQADLESKLLMEGLHPTALTDSLASPLRIITRKRRVQAKMSIAQGVKLEQTDLVIEFVGTNIPPSHWRSIALGGKAPESLQAALPMLAQAGLPNSNASTVFVGAYPALFNYILQGG
eukprot:jgi/Chlat1/7699/Chrsp64S09161